MIPSTRRNTKAGIEQIDLFTYEFLEKRTIYLFGEINSSTAAEIICQLKYLDAIAKKDITIMLNSAGGSVADGLAIIDCMDACRSDIKVIATDGTLPRSICFGLRNKRKEVRYAKCRDYDPSAVG